MPIVMKSEGQRLRMVVACDVCGGVISKQDRGIVVWDVDKAEATPDGGFAPYLIVHKGGIEGQPNCDPSSRRRVTPLGDYSWMPLDFFVARLCHNTGIDVAKARKAIGEVGMFL